MTRARIPRIRHTVSVGILQDLGKRFRALLDESAEYARAIENFTDKQLVGISARQDSSRYAIEMQRRLKDSVEALTAETIESRESAERLTGQLDASIGTLTAELITFRTSSDAAAGKLERLTRWLIGFTIVLVVLTLAVVVLTAVLAAKGWRSLPVALSCASCRPPLPAAARAASMMGLTRAKG
jgi:hypothetical protein